MISPSEIQHMQYEERGDVGIWTLENFGEYFQSGEIEKGESHYREVASADRMEGTVIVIEDAQDLGAEIRESLDHINEEWSRLADEVGVDRVAYVAGGMMASAVKAKVDADAEQDSFDAIDEAVEWARG
jgi:hypothetical protein